MPRITPGERVRPHPSAQPHPAARGGFLSDHRRQLRLLEALFFVAVEPLGADDLARHLGPEADIASLVRELAESYEGRGINLVRVAGGWTFRTAPDLGPEL